MRKLFYLFILFVWVVINVAFAQVATQEQCHQADDQLNQVYQQLRGTLNDAQKQQLKQAQRDWIKKRDAFVAANPGNTQGALYQATMQRVAELSGFIGRTPQAPQENITTPPSTQQGNQQTVTQEQCQQADAQLNKVYQQLRGTLDEANQKKLKASEVQWIKQKESAIASSSNPDDTQYQLVMQRLATLQEVMNRMGQQQPLEPQNQPAKKHLVNEANILSEKAGKLQASGDPKSAINLFEKSLKLYEDTFGPDNLHVASTLSHLGDCYEQTTNSLRAIPLLERAVSIDEKKWGLITYVQLMIICC